MNVQTSLSAVEYLEYVFSDAIGSRARAIGTGVGAPKGKRVPKVELNQPEETVLSAFERVAAGFSDEYDAYMSLQLYHADWCPRRKRTHLVGLQAFIADIDPYHLEPARTADEVLPNVRTSGIPVPNVVMKSGKGLQLVWLFHPVWLNAVEDDRYRLDRKHHYEHIWSNVAERIFTTLEPFGADAKSTDIVHVFRIPGTINTKYGTRVVAWIDREDRYTLPELCEWVGVHYSDFNEPQWTGRRTGLTRRITPESEAEMRREIADAEQRRHAYLTAISTRSNRRTTVRNAQTLYDGYASDIEKLVSLRRGDVEGMRENMLYVYGHCLIGKGLDDDQIQSRMQMLSNSFSPLLRDSEVTKQINDVIRHKESVGTAHRFTKNRLISMFNVTESEQWVMSVLITGESMTERRKWKKRQSASQRYDSQRKTGRRNNPEKRFEALQALVTKEPSLTNVELAERLSCSTRTVTRLKQRLTAQ